MSDNTVAEAITALQRGQEFEARGDLRRALESYDEAIARLELLARARQPDAAHHLGIAWMNRGNVLQREGSPLALKDAVVAYERGAVCLETVLAENDPAVRNSLGAAWMNRGLALHRIASPEALPAAEASFRQAIAVLSESLPEDYSWQLRNLAAARLNLANLLLDFRRFDEARTMAMESLPRLVANEKADLVAADLTLKARRAWCDALGQLLANPPAGVDRHELAAEASDVVDDGLGLIRHWQAQDPRLSSDLAIRFFRFGVQLYRFHQPHFLAEFVLENLGTSPAGRTQEFQAIARDSVNAALGDLRLPAFLIADNPAHNRLLETSRSLQELKAQLDAVPAGPVSTTQA